MVCAVAGFIAYRDVKLSAEVMLWIEAVSVGLIVIVLVLLPVHIGLQLDTSQFRLQGISFKGLGPALVLSIFSFVGFESATTLGDEARDPLRTIPRAVLQCALLAGVFFMLCAYSEVLGFRGQSAALSNSTSPLHMLAAKADVSPLGVAIDCGAFISMFACVLACATAAARVLLRMAHDGLLPAALRAHQSAPWHAGNCRHTVHRAHVCRYSRHGALEADRLHDVRPAGLAFCLRLSHRVRARRSRASLRAARTGPAFPSCWPPSASSPSPSSSPSRSSTSTPQRTPFTREFPISISATSLSGLGWYAFRRRKGIAA